MNSLTRFLLVYCLTTSLFIGNSSEAQDQPTSSRVTLKTIVLLKDGMAELDHAHIGVTGWCGEESVILSAYWDFYAHEDPPKSHGDYWVSIRTGERRKLVLHGQYWEKSLDQCSPDGKWLYYFYKDDYWRHELATGKNEQVLLNATRLVVFREGGKVLLSPDGKKLLLKTDFDKKTRLPSGIEAVSLRYSYGNAQLEWFDDSKAIIAVAANYRRQNKTLNVLARLSDGEHIYLKVPHKISNIRVDSNNRIFVANREGPTFNEMGSLELRAYQQNPSTTDIHLCQLHIRQLVCEKLLSARLRTPYFNTDRPYYITPSGDAVLYMRFGDSCVYRYDTNRKREECLGTIDFGGNYYISRDGSKILFGTKGDGTRQEIMLGFLR